MIFSRYDPALLEATLIRFSNTFATALLDPTFFAERVVNLWNNLPSDRVDFSSLASESFIGYGSKSVSTSNSPF